MALTSEARPAGTPDGAGPTRWDQLDAWIPRGPISAWVRRRLLGRPTATNLPPLPADVLVDDDLHLALHLLVDLDYRRPRSMRSAGVDPLLRLMREHLEDAVWEAAVADVASDGGAKFATTARVAGPAAAVDQLLDELDGPSLSAFMEDEGTEAQLREFLVHRSAYQLKEADPHTFGLARLSPGRRKSAYAEIQFDEYGNGEPGTSHAELFADAMAASGLDARYGAYVDRLPGATLATGNLLAILAGRPELLAPLVGHLALFEMTSVEPMGRYARAAARLGFPVEVRRFYDVHVVADRHHGDLARDVLLGPGGPDDDLDPVGLVLGAHALARAEERFTRALLAAWREGSSSLLEPLPAQPLAR